MNWADIDAGLAILVVEWLFIGYFLLLHAGQTILTTLSMKGLGLRMESVAVKMLPKLSAGYEIPVSVVVPVTEETKELGDFVQALFSLDYPEFEVVVVDDTENGTGLSQLQSFFDLIVFPEAYWRQVRARAVKNVYRSAHYPALRVVTKKPGGLGDAINSGVNAARYPVVCIVRPDCVLRRDSLRRLLQTFSEDSTTVAAGTGERFTNGRFVVNGFLERCRMPANILAWIRINTSLRRDLCARHGWEKHNAVLSFSDRFCAFRKDAMVQAGGCQRYAVNPVWELLTRIHRLHLASGKPYRVTFLPAPIVWRIPPATAGQLCGWATEEQHGLADALRSNRNLARIDGFTPASRLAMPFMRLTEVAGPGIEVLAFAFFLSAYAFGFVSTTHLLAFLLSSVGLGILLSCLAILLDGLVFRTYQNAAAYFVLLVAAVFENTGVRQLLSLCTAVKALLRKKPPKRATPSRTPSV